MALNFHLEYFDRFDNVWAHGDYAEITDNGGYIIHGRSDAVLNPGGVRIGTAEIYRQVEQVESVLESIVIGLSFSHATILGGGGIEASSSRSWRPEASGGPVHVYFAMHERPPT